MANLVTCLRILCAGLLLFFPAFSPAFFALYLTGGVSDMLDGFIFRRTHTASAFGEKLDTAADFAMVAACLIRLLPVTDVPGWVYPAIAVITAIKADNVILGFVLRGAFVTAHTELNRLTGILLFLLPLMLPFVPLERSAPVVCCAAAIAAIQEGHFIRTGHAGGPESP